MQINDWITPKRIVNKEMRLPEDKDELDVVVNKIRILL